MMTVRHWTTVILVILGIWIVSSAYFVNIESADGYGLVANAQYLLGQIDQYFADRGPLGSVLLIPARWMATYLELPAFDVRIQHLFYGSLHVFYIWGVYALIRRYHVDEVAVLVAFLATIPSFIFFSYAPFLSVDIYPGVIFLSMILLAQAFGTQPTWGTWTLLMLLGTAAPLIKHTYALFWFVVVITHGIPLLLAGLYRRALWLLGGAITSAGLTWLVLSMVMARSYPKFPPLLLPYYQIMAITSHYTPDAEAIRPWWFYFRNFAPGYGTLATILVPIGIFSAIHDRDSLTRRVVAAWILAFLIMILIPYKEARYLAFLAPLTAFFVVFPISLVLQHHRRWLPVMIFLLVIDTARSAIEASNIYSDFFASNPVVRFLRVIDDTLGYKRPILMATSLSFASRVYSPLIDDRYHRVFHVHAETIKWLYNNPNMTDLVELRSASARDVLQQPEIFPEKTVLLLANSPLLHKTGDHEFFFPRDHIQIAAYTERVIYEKIGGRYIRDDKGASSGPLIVIRHGAGNNQQSLIPLDKALSEDSIKALGYVPADTTEVWGVRITAMCKVDQCEFFSHNP
ncbi:putative Glycosyltransferase family 39 protein [Gammaproteobacteria bacterium]